MFVVGTAVVVGTRASVVVETGALVVVVGSALDVAVGVVLVVVGMVVTALEDDGAAGGGVLSLQATIKPALSTNPANPLANRTRLPGR